MFYDPDGVTIPDNRFPFLTKRDLSAAALLAGARRVPRYPEFTALLDHASLSVVGLPDRAPRSAKRQSL